jgi:hypothetical protein
MKPRSPEERLQILGRESQFDVYGIPSFFSRDERRRSRFDFICPAVGKNGQYVRLFKVFMIPFPVDHFFSLLPS